MTSYDNWRATNVNAEREDAFRERANEWADDVGLDEDEDPVTAYAEYLDDAYAASVDRKIDRLRDR